MNGAPGGSTPLSSSADSGLPSFASPPVVEVAVAVEFLQLPSLGAVELVRLHELWRDQFPKLREQPALPPSPPVGAAQGFQFQFTVGAPAMRLWMLNESEDELLQVQNDRVVLNWRQSLGDDHRYPRYDYLRDVYQRVYADFYTRVRQLNVGTFRPHTAGVTYVNRFKLEADETLRDAIALLNPNWNLLGDAATSEVSITTPVASSEGPGALTGQLVAKASSDSNDGNYGYLEVVTRVGVDDASGDVFDCLDLAHRSCVVGFDRLTTAKMHERWGKE